MKKLLPSIILIISLAFLFACGEIPPTDEGYNEADAKYLATRINADLPALITDALDALGHESLIGGSDFNLTLGEDLCVVYSGDALAVTNGGDPVSLISFADGAYVVRTDEGTLSLSSFASLLDDLGVAKLLFAAQGFALDRVIYSDLTYGDDGYYHLDGALLYRALLDGYMSAFDYEFPNATNAVRSLYLYTAETLIDNLNYDLAFSVKDKTILSLRASLTVTEQYTELSESKQIKCASAVLEYYPPTDTYMPATVSLDLTAEALSGAHVAISLSQDARREESEIDLSTDLRLDLSCAALACKENNGFTAKASANVTVDGSMTVRYPVNFPERYSAVDLSVTASVSDAAVSIYDSQGRLTSFEADGMSFPTDAIAELVSEAQQYDGASIEAYFDRNYVQGGELSITLTQSRSSVTYLGEVVYSDATVPDTFDPYYDVISDCERYEQIAHAMMNDLITNRFSEPFVYSPPDLALCVVVTGDNFILTDTPDALVGAVPVTLVGGRYTRTEQ